MKSSYFSIFKIIIKISFFLISFSLYFTINGFFFTDKSMHNIYINNGSYNILNQIPKILYSFSISFVIQQILKILSLSENDIIELKQERILDIVFQKSKKIENRLKIKFIIFFILGLCLMIFFWYFITLFCAVYNNTQIILIRDTIISFSVSLLYPFGLNLLPGIFRMHALKAKNKDKEYIYKIGMIIALL